MRVFSLAGAPLVGDVASAVDQDITYIVQGLRASMDAIDARLPGLGTAIIRKLAAIYNPAGLIINLFTTPEELERVVRTGLNTMRNRVNELDTAGRRAVLDGTIGFERNWAKAAGTIKDYVIQLSGVADKTVSAQMAAAWDEAIADAKWHLSEKVKSAAGPVLDAVKSYWWVLPLAGSGLWLLSSWLGRTSVTVRGRR